MFQRVAVPGTIFNELQSAYAASAAAIAGLGAVYLYIYGGMQVFAGMLADGTGSSKTLILGGALLAGGSIFFPLSGAPAGLYISRAVVGLGASLIYISMLKHIDITFSNQNFPLVFSCSIVAGYSGGLAATYPFERMASLAGWRVSLLGAGFACLFFVIFSSIRLKGTFNYRKTPNSLKTVKKVLKNKAIFPVMVSGCSNFSVYFLLQATIGKKMLEDFAGISSSQASAFPFLMMLATMISVLFHGFAGKKTSRRKPFALASGSLTAAGAGLILINLNFVNSTPLFLISYLFCAWAGGNILNATLVKEINPPGSAATAVGIYNGAMYSSVALTSSLAGAVMDMFRLHAREIPGAIIYPASSYSVIFTGCAALGIISIAAALKIRESPAAETPPGGNILLEE